MYSAEINRNNPALILFLLDCSYSMSENYGSTKMSKGEYLAKIINDNLDQVILSCEKGEEIRAYFEIGVYGYGDDIIPIIPIQTVIELADKPQKMIKTTLDGVEIEQPIWIEDPTRQANTDMKSGFESVKSPMESWAATHRGSFPPVLIHVSDGEWTSGSPISVAQNIQQDVFTDDGSCIVLNIHISNESKDSITYPDTEPQGSDHIKGLFNMSSVLPDSFLGRAQEKYPSVVAGARGYMYNASPEDLSRFFDIGTRLKG